MFFDLSSAADPLRIYSGSTGTSNDLDPSVLFSAAYMPVQAEKYSIALPAAGGSGTTPLSSALSAPPVSLAWLVLANGSLVYPYYYDFGQYYTAGGGFWSYVTHYAIWQAYPTQLKWWVGGLGQACTFHIWVFKP